MGSGRGGGGEGIRSRMVTTKPNHRNTFLPKSYYMKINLSIVVELKGN
jgi:hypothetical protein